MDGFIRSVESGRPDPDVLACLTKRLQPFCVDVMGYHTKREIPDY
jgi:hypothetical protein